MIKINRNIMFGKAGGTAGKNSFVYRMSIPAAAVKALGVTSDDRSVMLEIEDGKVTIKKA